MKKDKPSPSHARPAQTDLPTTHPEPNSASSFEGRRTSFAGTNFDICSDKWNLASGVSLNAARLRDKLTDELSTGLLLTLAHYSERKAARSVCNIGTVLNGFFTFIAPGDRIRSIGPQDFLNYRARIFELDKHEDRLIKIRPFFLVWHRLGHYGVSDAIADLLQSIRLKACPKGQAILRLDPEDGPLEPAESAALKAGVMAAYENSRISHESLVISLLLSYTGRRPIQIAHLKAIDLDDSRTEDLTTPALGQAPRKMLLVHIPRSKQSSSAFRQHRRSVAILPSLWAALIRQRDDVVHKFYGLLEEHWECIDRSEFDGIVQQLPLIPSWWAIRKTISDLHGNQLNGQLLHSLLLIATSETWHHKSGKIREILENAVELAKVESRSGTALKSNPRRLRYTKGTDAARAGYGIQVIGELLDHTTTSSVEVYTRTIPEHAIPINRAMAIAMAPLAQLFRGQVVDQERDAIGGENPSASRILFQGTGAATCGTGVRCQLSRLPRPCYTCESFQPWLDGPHEAVLEELLRERQQRLDILDDPTMVGIHDDIIFAVVNVIQRCETRNAEINAGTEKITQAKIPTEEVAQSKKKMI